MPEWISPDKERNFPNLTRDVYEKTSDEDEYNNCAAWAMGDRNNWLQPLGEKWHSWPNGAPLSFAFTSFVKAYEIFGFETCVDAAHEAGYEKIVIYAYADATFAHAAKLNADGSWSSKLGKIEDIQHDNLTCLEGSRPAYGQVRCYMKRPIPNASA
jgi:hypothetical protein